MTSDERQFRTKAWFGISLRIFVCSGRICTDRALVEELGFRRRPLFLDEEHIHIYRAMCHV